MQQTDQKERPRFNRQTSSPPNTQPARPKRRRVTITRALLRSIRSRDVHTQFVKLCQEKMPPEQFPKIMKVAQARADQARSQTMPDTYEILSAISEDLRALRRR